MFNLGYVVTIFLTAIIVFTPFICIRRKCNFVKLYLVSTPIIILAIALASYWPHFYTALQLDLMGFNYNGLSDSERLLNVAPELREEATKLYWSNMGVGWPLTAMFWCVILSPYPATAWFVSLLYNKISGNSGDKNT